MKIEKEINQRKFKNEYQKAHINILFTASWLSTRSAELLKPYKISWQQFNIMRILKGSQPEALTIKELTERMIDKMSNASRLVEKLKQKEYVERSSCTKDRRRVDILLTQLGEQVLKEASEILESTMEKDFSKLSKKEAENLNDFLDKIRS